MKGSVEKDKKKHDVVVPGEYLGSDEEYKPGEGTYVRFCQVYANRAGYKVIEKSNENVCYSKNWVLYFGNFVLFLFVRLLW